MVAIIYKMSKPYKKDDQQENVRKRAKIRNRYNKAPHLTKDTTWESDKHTIRHHKWETRGQPFPSRWPQGINKQTRERIANTRQKIRSGLRKVNGESRGNQIIFYIFTCKIQPFIYFRILGCENKINQMYIIFNEYFPCILLLFI